MKHVFIVLSACLFATMLVGCSDDPEATNEEEVITTISVTLTPTTGGGTPIILGWDDANLDAIVDAAEVTVSGGLKINTTYSADIQMANKSASSEIDIDEEILEEAEDHLFCFTVTGAALTIVADDEDHVDNNNLEHRNRNYCSAPSTECENRRLPRIR
jgi:hypothetical protein